MFAAELHRFLKRQDPFYLRALGAVFVLAALAAAVVVLRPLPIRALVEPPASDGIFAWIEALAGGGDRRIAAYVALIVVLELALFALRLMAERRSSRLTERFVRSIRGEIARNLLRGPFRRIQGLGAGAVLAAASGDLEAVQRVLREALVMGAVASLQLALMLVVVFFIEPWLFWILLVEILLLSLAIAAYATWRKKRYIAKLELEAELLGALSNLHHKNLDARFTGLRAVFANRLTRLARRLYGMNLLLWRRHSIYHAGTEFAIGVSAALCLVLLVVLNDAGPPPIGTFLVFVYYSVLIFPNLSQIGETVPMIHDARAALGRISAATNEEGARTGANTAPFGRIVFENVSLRSDTGDMILKDLSFAVEPGTKLGIFGDSGTGKTTILMLIMGLIAPTGGRVTVGGRVPMEMPLADRKRLYFLLRAYPAFISGTVRENIAFNRPVAPERLAAVLDRARLAARLAFEPAGVEAPVGEKGEPFSGGEQQRINLARAFLTDAPCLILDEALNSLDESNELAILSALLEARAADTMLVISHRQSVAQLFPQRIHVRRGGDLTLIGLDPAIPLASAESDGNTDQNGGVMP